MHSDDNSGIPHTAVVVLLVMQGNYIWTKYNRHHFSTGCCVYRITVQVHVHTKVSGPLLLAKHDTCLLVLYLRISGLFLLLNVLTVNGFIATSKIPRYPRDFYHLYNNISYTMNIDIIQVMLAICSNHYMSISFIVLQFNTSSFLWSNVLINRRYVSRNSFPCPVTVCTVSAQEKTQH